jgi:hypothetical protein
LYIKLLEKEVFRERIEATEKGLEALNTPGDYVGYSAHNQTNAM